MTSIFWFALVVGGGMLLLSVLGDIFGDAAGDFGDAGAEIDLGDADLGDADAGDTGADATGGFWLSVFSLRSLTYFLFGFGATGVLLEFVWQGSYRPLTLAASLGAGMLAGGLNAFLLGYLRRTDSGRLASDASLIGLVGRVTLPLSAGGTGKIEVKRAARLHTILARPFDAAPTSPEAWTRVFVVAMEDGIALVVPLDEAGVPLLDPATAAQLQVSSGAQSGEGSDGGAGR